MNNEPHTTNRKFAIYNDKTKSYQIIMPPHTEALTVSNVSNHDECEQFNNTRRNKENEIISAYVCFMCADWRRFYDLVNRMNEIDRTTHEVII